MSPSHPANAHPDGRATTMLVLVSLVLAGVFLFSPLATPEAPVGALFWTLTAALAVLAVVGIRRLAAMEGHGIYSSLTAALFGIWILYFWQLLVVANDVPRVLLPAPWLILQSLIENIETLGNDFMQTVAKAVVIGWLLGCSLGFVVAIAIDRLPFLQRGLLPIASLTSAIPLVGVAPIAVMWFGFEWPSKAAVVVVMVFFPVLVNMVAGLEATDRLSRDLIATWGASYWQALFKLRLPAAAPFIFNALKINSTLALIGAIVAEFFGTPIVGMGFRISTEVGKLNIDLVWAEIAVAAVAGSAFYGVIALIERAVTFWHPSVRGGRK